MATWQIIVALYAFGAFVTLLLNVAVRGEVLLLRTFLWPIWLLTGWPEDKHIALF